VRSGKSAFAVQWAKALGPRRGFIATAQVYDDEMKARALAHQEERGQEFVTVEEPLDLLGALEKLSSCDAVVVDCLTLWLTNLLLRGDSPEAMAQAVQAFAHAARQAAPTVIVVSNEVGMGIVPENALARRFRDVAGRAHQVFARQADQVVLAMMGLLLRAKPGPIVPLLPMDSGAGFLAVDGAHAGAPAGGNAGAGAGTGRDAAADGQGAQGDQEATEGAGGGFPWI
jgi:adenosylcobinamide kinase/adenosylcobinamide-phosphate guanylyltransferase